MSACAAAVTPSTSSAIATARTPLRERLIDGSTRPCECPWAPCSCVCPCDVTTPVWGSRKRRLIRTCQDPAMVAGSIPSPSSGAFHIGPVLIHAYGLMYILALFAAIVCTTKLWEGRGGHRDLVADV